MKRAEAMRILDPETRLKALEPCRLDCELMRAKMEEACRVAVQAMRALERQNKLVWNFVMRDVIAAETLEKFLQKRWVSVEERLPEEWVYVLTCDRCGNIHIMQHSKLMKFPFGIGPSHPRYHAVTHWMPLPMLPEVEE